MRRSSLKLRHRFGDLLSSLDKRDKEARKIFQKGRSLKMIMKQIKPLSLHEALRIATEVKLEEKGYKIVNYEVAPVDIKAVGKPDIIAEKNGEWFIIEVEPIEQLARYTMMDRKLILVTNIKSCKNVEMWGIQELEEKTQA